MSAEICNIIVFLQTYLETNLLTKPIYYEKVTFTFYDADGIYAADGIVRSVHADRE